MKILGMMYDNAGNDVQNSAGSDPENSARNDSDHLYTVHTLQTLPWLLIHML